MTSRSDHSHTLMELSPRQENSSSAALEEQPQEEHYNSLGTAGFVDIFKHFFVLGWTAFGGPAAHVAMFQSIFVEKVAWMSSVVFLELLALGQCLPGPTSTQMSFAIGVVKKGIPGGLLSGILFQYPGLVVMSAVGIGVKEFVIDSWKKGISDGLAAAAVALVAVAASTLSKKICIDKITSGICVGAAVVAYYQPQAWTFPVLIILGGLITLAKKWKDPMPRMDARERVEHLGLGPVAGGILIVTWAVILVLVITFARQIPYEDFKPLHWFEAFYRTGSIIFGGGQVVLPLIINEVTSEECANALDSTEGDPCKDSWVTPDQFYLGLGIVQALPGPLFNFSAFLGAITASRANIHPLVGVCVFWIGLFAPGILLIYGVLPFWRAFRNFPVYRRALPGLNAAAVGLIVTAVFSMFLSVVGRSSFPHTSVGIGIIAFALGDIYKVQAPLIILLGGLTGLLGWGLSMK